MKYIKIFDYLPKDTKTIVATILLSTLTLYAERNGTPKSEKKSYSKHKIATFNNIYGMNFAQTYVIKHMPGIEPVVNVNNKNNVLFKDSVNSIMPLQNTEEKAVDHALPETTTETVNESGVRIVTGKKCVKYIYPDGSTETRQGGTLPWRHKNPGAIRQNSKAVGKASGFAIFESEEAGMDALRALLRGKGYRDLTLKAAVFKYAPPHENDTKRYQSNIKRLTGLDLDRKLCDLNDTELECVVKTIKQLEGWVPGQITRTEAINTSAVINDTLAKAMQYTR